MAKSIALENNKNKSNTLQNKVPSIRINKSNKFLLPTLGVFLALSLFFSFLFLFQGTSSPKKEEPINILVNETSIEKPNGACSLRFTVAQAPPPPPPEEAVIECKKLSATLVDLGEPINSNKTYPLNSIPNDFKGTLWLTCIGQAKNDSITSMKFNVFKTIGSDTQTFSNTIYEDSLEKVNSSSCDEGFDCYQGITSFDIEGPGSFRATSQVCNLDRCVP